MPPDIQHVEVPLGDRRYAVVIGPGVRRMLSSVIREVGARKVAIVSARPREWVPDPGVPSEFIPVRDGERHKRLSGVEVLCRAFARYGISRADAVVSVGGGSTSDLAGLAAALYHRGVPVVHLPTSLLAQVDASVGGKTAVNLPEGKNLVGSYWQPRAVLCDTDYLRTLPREEMINGYGEIARCHFIGAGDLRGLRLPEQIAASVALKAEIVAADERDTGRRYLLNYGHTLGHALELVTGFAVRHGEAVAIGTVFAGVLAGALGRIPAARVAEHAEVVRSYGLPTSLPDQADAAALIRLMRRDKKAASEGLSFVLDGPAGPELVHDIPEQVVAAALSAVPRARSHAITSPRRIS
jgi:5-deoxy-5-amino-3-dehydroquinate synthase